MRTMLRGGISFYFALILALIIPNVFTVILAAFLAVGTAVLCFFPKVRRAAVFTFFGAVAFSVFLLSSALRIKPYENSVGKTEYISGTVLSYENSPKKYGKEILLSPDEKPGNIRIFFTGYAEYKRGDRVLIPVTFTDRGTLTFADLGKGIFAHATGKTDGELLWDTTAESRLCSLSETLSLNIASSLPGRYGDLVRGITAGDKAALSEKDASVLKNAGFSHLVNISGLHMSLVAAFVFGLFSLFGKRKLSAVITLSFVFFYVALCGFQVSALRAGLMLAVYYTGFIFERRSDSLNSLGFAALIILLFNPFAVADPSFQLSLLSTLGIIFITEKLSFLYNAEKITSVSYKTLSFLAPSFAAVIFSAPASAVFFGEVNLLSPVSNLFLSFLVTPLVISGMLLGMITFLSSPFLTYIFSFVCRIFCSAVFFIADFFGREKILTVRTDTVFSVFVTVAVTFSVIFFLSASHSVRRSVILITSTVFLCAAVFFGETAYNKSTLCYIICEDGLPLLCVNGKDGYVTYGDLTTGSAYTAADVLKGKKISAVMLSSSSDDSVNAAAMLCKSLSCGVYTEDETAKDKITSRYNVSRVKSLSGVSKTDKMTEIALRSGSIKITYDGVNYIVSRGNDEIFLYLVKNEDKWYNVSYGVVPVNGETVIRVYEIFGKTVSGEVRKLWVP